jgi:predicted RNA binding protein YcfA (HicA-like mRNA interferase family)
MPTFRQVKTILEKNGYRQVRTTGSHGRFVLDLPNGERKCVTLMVNHLNKSMGLFVIKEIERTTGLKLK